MRNRYSLSINNNLLVSLGQTEITLVVFLGLDLIIKLHVFIYDK